MTSIHVHGKHLTVTPALQEYADRKIGPAQTWFDEPVSIHVSLSVQGHKQENAVEVTIPYHSMVFRAEVRHVDMYAAIDEVADKIERILRKYKERARRKLRAQSRALAHHLQQGRAVPVAVEEADDDFPIMKVKRIDMKPVDIQEAILQMNMTDHSFHLFHNRETNRMEVVYRRKDGTYGHLLAE
ncbi:putative sigma-54 modulation protein [Paenibacillus phyllosphaerae]|uniref:Ribosome hibernation promoting factor n=1 Tax=Paenibacillus phyllosphaerae TaxID=274593 RepID=A0A7W5FQK4_9BACL|nr:ribosome-associated translation inhibitor RaiA [Paenibacillus phyllosphaerae]MBB3113337.1 putative sigma-54 modulation protein [Paenibacillus phyllosphaerae]